MAKTYIDTVKYIIRAKIEVDGLVEKPDVVGAIFGQTEGLLGEDLDLRELQKSGRIGRIEVETKTKNGKTEGEIIIPSSLDKAETAIIAAALETVDRVGPCEAKITTETIEDTRARKREFIVNRAKQLLREFIQEKMPESRELAELVKAEVRQAELVEYGPERIPAGPEVESSEEVIVVEGRADVLNLLKHGFKNVISLKGAKIPRTIVELSKRKTIILFVDGDRGGDIIAKQLVDVAEIDFIARAPDGKEVEELTRKEIIKALRNKLPAHQFLAVRGLAGNKEARDHPHKSPQPGQRREGGSDEVENQLVSVFNDVKDSMKAVFLDKNLEKLKEVKVSEMIREIQNTNDVFAIVFDGIITQRLIDLASKKGVKYLVGLKSAKVRPGSVRTIVVEH